MWQTKFYAPGNISHDGDKSRTHFGNRQNQREIEKNRVTPHHEIDPESTLPKPKKPSDQNDNKICRFIANACFGLMFKL